MNSYQRILIIDDDGDDRALLTDAVSETAPSIVCCTAVSGVEGIEYLNSVDLLPDLIFLDLNMPRMGGSEFLRKIKMDARLKNIPVIIYSTSGRKEDAEDTKRLGAVYFFTKPVLFKDMCRELAVILNTSW